MVVAVSAIFSCCAAASSKVQPLAMDCATVPDTPAASSSVLDARKIACGERNRSSSLPEVRDPIPGTSFNASQYNSSSRLNMDACISAAVELYPNTDPDRTT